MYSFLFCDYLSVCVLVLADTKKIPTEAGTFNEVCLFLNNLLVVLQDVFGGADLV